MAKKIGIEESIKSIKSIGALQQYYFKIGEETGLFLTKITIINENTGEVEKLKANITVEFDTMRQRINIMWEDAGYTRDEFREKGLYGYYDCQWVPIDFEDDMLVIKSLDSDKTVYVE